MKRTLATLSVLAALLTGVSAQALRPNPGFNSRVIPANDDGSSGLEPIGFTINFFGKLRSHVYVNNNGNLTFDSPLATFTPFGLLRTQREIIAPFFADVDTRSPGSRLVTFGQDLVNGHRAFGANYIQVGYYSFNADKLNSFQVVLIEREDIGPGDFDIEFNYAQIRWETGDASGGVNGFGGVPAAVGWSNGSSESWELPGSLISGQFLDGGPRALVRQRLTGAVSTSAAASAGTPGRLVFRARGGVISPGLRITSGIRLPDAILGNSYTARLSASGGDAPFRWTMAPDVMAPPGLTFGSGGVVSGVPTAAGTYSYTLGVTAKTEDGDVTVYDRGSITIRPPSISIRTACPLDDATAGRPYSVSLLASGSSSGFTWSVADPYSLPPGIALSAAGRLAGTPLVPGTYIMNIGVRSSASDGSQPAQTQCRLNVQPAAVQLASGCALRATASVPFSQILTPEGGFDPYRFDLVGQLPLGLALTARGVIAGTPVAPGTYPFQIAVTDSRGEQTAQSCSITVDPEAFSVASACPLPSGVTGTPYRTSLPSGYTWSISSGALPGGLALSPDGSISGTPMTAGAARFGLIATDSAGRQVGQACSLTMNRGPLSIHGCPLPEAGAGEPYSVALNALGGSAPYFFTVAGSLPDGLELSTDGVLRGSTSQSGAFAFTVLVREASGQTASQACSLAVARPLLRIASACPLPDGRLGEAYSTQVRASGGAAPYRFEFGGFLPDGLDGSSDGSIRGTPRTLGGRSFTVRVVDSQNRAESAMCSINVAVPRVPQVRLGDLPATLPAAASDAGIVVELADAYSQPIEGQVVLEVLADTRSPEAMANQPDPRLRFLNGQLTTGFTIPAGATRTTVPLSSTGTVASTVYVSLAGLKVAGADLPQFPSPRSFRIPPAAPVVTSACYVRTQTGIEVRVNGLSSTRELQSAQLSAGAETFHTSLDGISAQYYGSAETIRAGGTFALQLPYELRVGANLPVGTVTLSLSNTIGATPAQTLQACP
jgi:hypothetical protein